MQEKNISDDVLVLARTNYGEKDRILTALTASHGKVKVIAKSVRASSSRLAGGIELLSENHFVLVRNRSEMFTLTSAKMKKYFGNNIAKDIKKSEFAYHVLKTVNKLTPDGEGSEYYPYILDCLRELDKPDVSQEQLKIWFNLKILDLNGSSPNLNTLKDGQALSVAHKYSFDYDDHCFFIGGNDDFTPDHIKILRYFKDVRNFKAILNCSEELTSKCSLLTDRLTSQLLH